MDKNYVELRGTKAGCDLNSNTGKVKIFTEEYGHCVDYDPVTADDSKGVPAHEGNLRHFVDVLQGRAVPDFEPIQGVNMIKILSAVYESARTGREVQL